MVQSVFSCLSRLRLATQDLTSGGLYTSAKYLVSFILCFASQHIYDGAKESHCAEGKRRLEVAVKELEGCQNSDPCIKGRTMMGAQNGPRSGARFRLPGLECSFSGLGPLDVERLPTRYRCILGTSRPIFLTQLTFLVRGSFSNS